MATEKRLIEYVVKEEVCKLCNNKKEHCGKYKCPVYKAPTVDAVEVVHGRWEPRTDIIGFVRCSVCHDCNIYGDWADGKKWNYCPNCGAKMDGDGNE